MRTDDNITPRLAADAAVTAGLLDSGRSLAWASGMMLLMTAVVWLKGHPVHWPALVGTVVMASVQGVLAQRVRFDAGIFRLWASRWHHPLAPAADLAAFDVRVGRQTPPAASVEADLAERRRGAIRLLVWQAACATLQLGLTVIALWP